MVITWDERRAFVAGALMALDFAGLTDAEMIPVLKRMLITPEEINDHTMRHLKKKVSDA